MQDKITKSAELEDCSLRIPGICCFDPQTVVFAHAPCVDKGMGIKSPSWWGCYACNRCHDVIDGRLKTSMDKNEITAMIMPAIYETQTKLLQKGLIKV